MFSGKGKGILKRKSGSRKLKLICAVLLSHLALASHALASNSTDPNGTGADDVWRFDADTNSYVQLNSPLADPLDLGTDTLIVGRSGSGEFLTDAGSEVMYGDIAIAKEAGSTGKAVLSGAGSMWNGTNSDSRIVVGEYGSGRLEVDQGAVINSTNTALAVQTDSNGVVEIEGAGTRWINTASFEIAQREYGVTRVLDGAELSTDELRIATHSGAVGYFEVGGTDPNGEPSLLTVSGKHYVGYGGTGGLSISAGATANSNGDVWLARHAGAVAHVDLRGYGSQWNIAGDLRSGSSLGDVKYIEIEGGARLISKAVDLRSGNNTLSSIVGPGSMWEVSEDFLHGGGIGIFDGGVLSIDPGALVEVGGQVVVEGSGSRWNNSNSIVFRQGSSYTSFHIRDGGYISSNTAYFAHCDGNCYYAYLDMGVSGANSEWDNSGDFYVGLQGEVDFSIVDGGRVTNSDSYVGYGSHTNISMLVTGKDSRWDNHDFLLGNGYNADLSLGIFRGGVVASNSSALAKGQRSDVIVTVEDDNSLWDNAGSLVIGELGTATLNVEYDGRVEVGGNIVLGDQADGSGAVNLIGGTLRLNGGTITKGDGTATLDFLGGRLEGVSLIDIGTTVVQEGGTLAPGTSAGTTTMENGYTLNGGSIEIEIDGTGVAGTNWDLVSVNGVVDLLGGNATADGTLDVILGFLPSISDEFLILENDGTDTILGTFADGTELIASFGSSQVTFAIDYTAGDGNDISLTATDILLGGNGDLDGNGTTDASDFFAWQRNPSIGVLADWQAHYAAGNSPSVSTVPEPSTMMLLLLAMGLLCNRTRS